MLPFGKHESATASRYKRPLSPCSLQRPAETARSIRVKPSPSRYAGRVEAFGSDQGPGDAVLLVSRESRFLNKRYCACAVALALPAYLNSDDASGGLEASLVFWGGVDCAVWRGVRQTGDQP
jgi:hypothetical protein